MLFDIYVIDCRNKKAMIKWYEPFSKKLTSKFIFP